MAKSPAEAPADLPVDPGCLPAWGVGDLPEPPKFSRKNWIRMIGPGLVLAGGSIGTGEWVMGPQAAARYQGAMLWAVLLSILAQVVLNTEVMRYTLCTGEPIMTGFMRCKPGPKFWIILYLAFDIGGWMPALAGLAAQIFVVLFQGLTPQDTINQETVRIVSAIVFVSCAALVLFGGKIYNTLQIVLGGKVISILAYLGFCCLFYVSYRTWGSLWSGLFDFTRYPVDAAGNANIDWSLISALAGFTGIGGLGNIMASNFVREKGWGMGGQVGAIPSAFGGHKLTLSHIGIICRSGPETARKFKAWFTHIRADQYVVWTIGSLLGMMLPCMLGAQYLDTSSLTTEDRWRWAAAMAQDFGAAKGEIFRFLTLICGLIIIVPGQFYLVDNIARRWADAFWSGSRRVRAMDPSRVKVIYYCIALAYTVAGLLVLLLFPKLSATQMMVILGNLANLTISMTIIQTMYVNVRFLPKETRPTLGKQIAMGLAATFFLTMFGLVVNQKLVPLFLKLFD